MRIPVLAWTVAALIAASCGGTAQPAQTASPAATAAAKTAAATAAPATAAAPTPFALPKPEKASIKIGSTSTSANEFPARFALDAGIYKKYGLEVEVLQFGGTAGTTALVAGQIDLLRGSDEAVMYSQKTNAPIIMVASSYNKFLDYFLGGKDIKTGADLKGKKVGTSTFGGQSHRSSLLSVQHLGLKATDVQFVEVGGQSARKAALVAGSISAMIVDTAEGDRMAKEGYNILVNLPEFDKKQALGPITVLKKYSETNPNTVLAVLASVVEAQNLIFTDTPKAVAAYAAWAKIKPENAEAELKDYMKAATRDLSFDEGGIKALQDFTAMLDPTVATVDIKNTYSLKFHQQLKDMGFFKLIKVPGY